MSSSAPDDTRRIAEDRVAVVVNGNAKQVTDDLVEILDQIIRSGDLFVSRSEEEGQDIARRIVERGYHTVLTGGGDGTFTRMVTWITRRADELNLAEPRFGLLRLGTGNALAWVLGAQTLRGGGVFADLGRLRQEGGSRELRLVETGGYLAPFAGLGVDAMTLQYYTELRGYVERLPLIGRKTSGGLAYFLAIAGRTAPAVMRKPHHQVRVVNRGADAYRLGADGQPAGRAIEAGEVLYEGPTRGVWMSTIPYWGFGARVFPFAEDRADRFNLRLVDIGPLEFALNLRAAWNGTYRSPRLSDFLVESVSVHFEEPMAMQIGGDPAGEHRTVEARLSRSIRVVDYYAPPPVE